MTAKRSCFRHFSRRLQVGWLGLCALLALAAFAGSQCRAQAAPPQQTPPPPAQPATQDVTPPPASPESAQPATDAQSPPAPDQQSTPAPAAQETTTTPAQPAAPPDTNLAPPDTTATPAAHRDPYPGMTPEERSKQEVAQQCADLLKLATDLKSQVDKARKDELSVSVVRKAAELEQMAHKVRNGTPLSASK